MRKCFSTSACLECRDDCKCFNFSHFTICWWIENYLFSALPRSLAACYVSLWSHESQMMLSSREMFLKLTSINYQKKSPRPLKINDSWYWGHQRKFKRRFSDWRVKCWYCVTSSNVSPVWSPFILRDNNSRDPRPLIGQLSLTLASDWLRGAGVCDHLSGVTTQLWTYLLSQVISSIIISRLQPSITQLLAPHLAISSLLIGPDESRQTLISWI